MFILHAPVRKRSEEKIVRTHLEILYNKWEGCAEEHDLAVSREEGEQLLHDGCEFGREKFVGFVHDKNRTFAEIGNILASQIENTTRSADEHMNRL